MKLEVSYAGPGPLNGYNYQIAALGKGQEPTVDERAYLYALAPRIKAMASHELGDYFLRLEPSGTGDLPKNVLLLGVRNGTSSAPVVKFRLRSLIGWIELFDDEPRAV